jgi:hypothetical protein
MADCCAQYAQYMLNANSFSEMVLGFPIMQPFKGYVKGTCVCVCVYV